MSDIVVNDLNTDGLGLFSGSESFIDSMQDLSENELKMTVGGKGSKSSSSKSSKSKSSKSYSSSYGGCYCHCPGGGVG
jgi:hypothetical protein